MLALHVTEPHRILNPKGGSNEENGKANGGGLGFNINSSKFKHVNWVERGSAHQIHCNQTLIFNVMLFITLSLPRAA